MNILHIAVVAFACGTMFGVAGSIVAMKIDEFRGRKVQRSPREE